VDPVSGHTAEKDAGRVLTMADIVRLGRAVLTDESGVAIGFDHSVVEQIIARKFIEAADAVEDECTHQRGPYFCGSADWLRNRAARVTPPGGGRDDDEQSSRG
jgi:hypothetical protein